jgi:hypothetical protein
MSADSSKAKMIEIWLETIRHKKDIKIKSQTLEDGCKECKA